MTWVRIDPLGSPTPLRRVWLAATRAASDEIVAVSRFIAGRLRDAGLGSRLLYDPFGPSLVARRRFSGGNTQRIVHIANFTRGRGQDDAISAL